MKKLLLAFAAVAVMGLWSCETEFDDSVIFDRLENLEDRVASIEAQLKSLNSNLSLLDQVASALNGGGYISKVETTANGLNITVVDFKTGKPETFEVLNGKNGQNGTNGTNGKDGKDGKDGVDGKDAPELGVAYDEDAKRFYWTLDGEPIYTDEDETELLWCTGENGADGAFADVEFKLAQRSKSNPSAPAANDEDADRNSDIILWTRPVDSTSAADWTPSNGVIRSMTLFDAEYKDGMLYLYLGNGDKDNYYTQVVECPIKTNPLVVTFEVNGDEVEEYGEVAVAPEELGTATTVVVNVDGASENYVVKAEMQNAESGFKVVVNEDNSIDITVTDDDAAEDGSKVLIEVLDGPNCYHTWLTLVKKVYYGEVSVKVLETDAVGYLPVVYTAEKNNYFNWLPDQITVHAVVTMKSAPAEDVTLTLKINEDYTDGVEGLEFEETEVTIEAGKTMSAPVAITFDREGLSGTGEDSYFRVAIDEMPETVAASDADGTYVWISDNFCAAYPLTADMIESKFVIDVENMFDGDASTYATNSKVASLYTKDDATAVVPGVIKSCEWLSTSDIYSGYAALYGYYFDIKGLSDVVLVKARWQHPTDGNANEFVTSVNYGFVSDEEDPFPYQSVNMNSGSNNGNRTPGAWVLDNNDTFTKQFYNTATNSFFNDPASPFATYRVSKIEKLRVGWKSSYNGSPTRNNYNPNEGDWRVAEFELYVRY